MREVVMVPTGTANTASVVAAFRRIGATVAMAGTAADVASADSLVLPGVGAFGAAMAHVEGLGMRRALRQRIDAGLPTFAVCVGMQLLSTSSEESPDAAGLGAVNSIVGRFADGLKVPQLGWNQVEPHPESRFIEPGWAYFANSFRLERVPEGWLGATTDYGGEFVSAMERENVLACQFHPELSGSWGARLLARWLDRSKVAA